MCRKKSHEIPQGIFAHCHLAEMVFPDVGFDGASREGLAVDGDDLPFAVEAGIGG